MIILYHGIEKTVVNTINGAYVYAQGNMARMGVILLLTEQEVRPRLFESQLALSHDKTVLIHGINLSVD